MGQKRLDPPVKFPHQEWPKEERRKLAVFLSVPLRVSCFANAFGFPVGAGTCTQLGSKDRARRKACIKKAHPFGRYYLGQKPYQSLPAIWLAQHGPKEKKDILDLRKAQSFSMAQKAWANWHKIKPPDIRNGAKPKIFKPIPAHQDSFVLATRRA